MLHGNLMVRLGDEFLPLFDLGLVGMMEKSGDMLGIIPRRGSLRKGFSVLLPSDP